MKPLANDRNVVFVCQVLFFISLRSVTLPDSVAEE